MSLSVPKKVNPKQPQERTTVMLAQIPRSRVAFNATQRAFRCPRYWTRLTLSANSAQIPPLGTTHFEVPDGEALQPRAALARDYAHSVTSG
ncbi:hypothetical protein BDQ94DRAFT_177497 [Aspergillus welwitschiae]|uniref:Uncharacterized protein n=1 Tax=Aspergillus welwitschiae TaxID=1341132 RepID=A0A3F3PIA0_9EURO|nr:hypothetical protein BDQ94DRAFT_177497 [Aspergillus welwitschiae]RDH26513.1 hypothetical protein BDQ94DRAFT_177497 [Aspergillus welwitschiae]